MLDLIEDERFFFDEAAADMPVRFIERFCTHRQGKKLAGKPFLLEPIQKRIVRDLFGWKWREIDAHGKNAGKRRFRDVYWEAAIGAGKSPLLAAIGLYGLVADGEPGAILYSLASAYSQARIVFDTAKRMPNRKLADVLQVVEREIRYPATGSVWKITSGKGPGAGQQPSMTLADEAHDWRTSTAYAELHERQGKREQPLCVVATNAPKSQASFCWQLREKALAALNGTGEVSLYPIVWAADPTARSDDPAAWKQANPLIGVTMQEETIAALCDAAIRGGESEEADFRRGYLGITPQSGGDRLIDLALWDAATATAFNASEIPAGTPLYVGLDMSQGNDLCSAAFVWPTLAKFYLGVRFWVPRVTAEHYEAKESVPYKQWAAGGYVTLLDAPTVSLDVQADIAAEIIALHKVYPIHAVCFDRAYASHAVATLDAAGIACVAIAQGWSVSGGYSELDRRLKERSIAIVENPVLRFCAENAQRKTDAHGNFWAVKPNASGRYAGKRGKKIDGVTAAGTAMTEARKHVFPKKTGQFIVTGIRT